MRIYHTAPYSAHNLSCNAIMVDPLTGDQPFCAYFSTDCAIVHPRHFSVTGLTPVIFRITEWGETIAIFPLSGAPNIDFALTHSRAATPAEYTPLQAEYTALGYDLLIILDYGPTIYP